MWYNTLVHLKPAYIILLVNIYIDLCVFMAYKFSVNIMNIIMLAYQITLASKYLIIQYITPENAAVIAGIISRVTKNYALNLLGIAIFINSMVPYSMYEVIKPVAKATIIPEEQRADAHVAIDEVKKSNWEIGTVTLEERYRALAGKHYYSNVTPYLPIIDKVLVEKGLDGNTYFIQVMFFIGQRESHWNTGSISSYTVGTEHPTGIFQFLPSTFRSVSGGNIFNAEDQIRAYVTMCQRGRIREFSTLALPELNPAARAYMKSW